MSNTYELHGVTIDAQGGGWYELTHASLAEPVKVQGKPEAEARAAEIAREAPGPDDAPLEQADLGAALSALQQPSPNSDIAAALAAKDAEIEALRAQLAAQPVTTVSVAEGREPQVPTSVARRYEGKLSDAELEASPLKFTRIVLEEDDSIPPTGLFVSHNGRSYVIVPGEEVDVPDFLLGVLNDAKMSAPIVDNKTKKVLGYRDRSRYPYRRV